MSPILLELMIIFFLIALNGLFAMSELAIVSARPARLELKAGEGSTGARAALDLSGNPNRFLSTIQVGITLIGILAGAYGGATIAQQLTIRLSDIQLLARYAGAISLGLVVSIITFLTVVLGELVPKRIALQHAERIASAVARPMMALSTVARPVVQLFGLATDAVLKVLGVQVSTQAEASEEEIKMLVEQSARAGIIELAERDMVEGVFRLGDRPLGTMMTPRREITWLDINASDLELRQVVRDSNHSRFPVCDGQLDKLVGVVRAKDILSECLSGEPLNLKAVMKEPLVAPESMTALRALERFRETGFHLIMLIDEYGGVEGLVTLIDVLEAIVGDIPTLDELSEPPIISRDENSWLVDGLITIDDFRQAFGIRVLPGEGQYHSLGGFVVYMLARVPRTGDHFTHGGYLFEVVDMDGNRVDKVLLQSASPDRDESAPDEPGPAV
jgi:putative hemolysin